MIGPEQKEVALTRAVARSIWLTSVSGVVNPIAPFHALKCRDGLRNLERLERARAKVVEERARSGN